LDDLGPRSATAYWRARGDPSRGDVRTGGRSELEAAVAWYDKQADGLGLRLVLAVDGAVARIAAQPSAYPEIPGIQARVAVRRARVRGFPYSVAFVELDDELRVIAVAHDKRRPGYWLKRLDR
jgi:toxin ParE1/3/4